jgi:endonuclease-3 related protein
MIALSKLYRILLKTYGKQDWWPAETPFEVCVGAILTQNTAWKNVEKAIENLKKQNLLSPEKLLRVDTSKLKELIRPAGFYNQKTERLKLFSSFVVKNGGISGLRKLRKEQLRKMLLETKGIGRETADSILLYALEKPAFVVDTYTKRLLFRLGILKKEDESYEKVKSFFENEIPAKDTNVPIYKEFHALIVEHSKTHCKKKPDCKGCPLKSFCTFNSLE